MRRGGKNQRRPRSTVAVGVLHTAAQKLGAAGTTLIGIVVENVADSSLVVERGRYREWSPWGI